MRYPRPMDGKAPFAGCAAGAALSSPAQPALGQRMAGQCINQARYPGVVAERDAFALGQSWHAINS